MLNVGFAWGIVSPGHIHSLKAPPTAAATLKVVSTEGVVRTP